MTAGLLILPGAQPSRSRNGGAVTAELRFYENDTTTPKPTYTTSALSIQHPFPIVSDDAGRFALIWADTGTDMAPSLFTVNWATEDGQVETWDDVRASTAITTGPTGPDGWTPEFAIVADSARRVQQVVDWFGGSGSKPATGDYVGATGFVALIADGVDIRGPVGAGAGNVNSTGSIVTGRAAIYSDTTGDLIQADVAATGTGAPVRAVSPGLTTPSLGVATATSVNKVALTAPASGSTLTVADGKTLTASNSLTLAGTDGVTLTFPPANANIGYLEIPQNSQSGPYTAVLADSAKQIFHPAADNSPRTFTIPANASVAYPVGTALTFVNMVNTVTIAITSDTLILAGVGSTGSRSLAANGIATALKITTTSWLISGTGLT